MQTTTASQFTKSPTAYLKRAVAGEEVLITDNGRPVARLTPVVEKEALPLYTGETVDSGLIESKGAPLPAEFWELPRPADPDGAVRTSVLREREDSW